MRSIVTRQIIDTHSITHNTTACWGLGAPIAVCQVIQFLLANGAWTCTFSRCTMKEMVSKTAFGIMTDQSRRTLAFVGLQTAWPCLHGREVLAGLHHSSELIILVAKWPFVTTFTLQHVRTQGLKCGEMRQQPLIEPTTVEPSSRCNPYFFQCAGGQLSAPAW